MIDCAIQIVNYNTKNYLDDCVQSILGDIKEGSFLYKIFVLDNHSDDDLDNLRQKYTNQNVEFYFSEKNYGFGAGHNILSEKLQSKYIAILNPDIKIIESNTFDRLVKFFEDDRVKNIGAIGPRLLTSLGDVQKWDHGELAFRYKFFGLGKYKKRISDTKVAWVSGAFLIMRRDIFDKVGGFDPKFFLYKEEEDLLLHFRKLGYHIVYTPSVSVLHYGSVVASKKVFFGKSERYFIKKNSFPFLWPIVFIIHVIKNIFYKFF